MWHPLGEVLQQMPAHGHPLVVAISPFIKFAAIERLLSDSNIIQGTKFVVRWRGDDLLSGSSDVSVYSLLKERQMKLYAHRSIHLKLFLFNHGHAVLSTGNLTLKGLGLCE